MGRIRATFLVIVEAVVMCVYIKNLLLIVLNTTTTTEILLVALKNLSRDSLII